MKETGIIRYKTGFVQRKTGCHTIEAGFFLPQKQVSYVEKQIVCDKKRSNTTEKRFSYDINKFYITKQVYYDRNRFTRRKTDL